MKLSDFFCHYNINGITISFAGMSTKSITEKIVLDFYNFVLENFSAPSNFKLARIDITGCTTYYIFHKLDSKRFQIETHTYKPNSFTITCSDKTLNEICSNKKERKIPLTINGSFALTQTKSGIRQAPYTRRFHKPFDDDYSHYETEPIIKKCAKFVYIFEMINGTIKIGVSSNVKARALHIIRNSGLKILRCCHTAMKFEGATIIEKNLHKIFSAERTIGEFFSTKFETARTALEKEAPIIDIDL